MANFSGHFSEKASKLKDKFFPRDGKGNYGSFNSLLEELFINWCKEKDTVEFWEVEMEEADRLKNKSDEIRLKCELNINMIKNREYNNFNKNWEAIKTNIKLLDIKEFLLNCCDSINDEDFDYNLRLKTFRDLTKKQNISLDYFKKLLNFIIKNKK